MGDGETPAFLCEPWGLTQQLGSRWAGAHTLTGGLSAPTQQERQDWASWALRALHQKALTSHCFPATLPSVLALGFVGPAVGAGGLFRKMGVAHQLICMKGVSSVPFGKDFVDLKDTANLWSI